MDREIKFRAKTGNGEWIYGGIAHQTDFYGKKVDRWYIIDGEDTRDYDIGYNYLVDRQTIGQYTGLKDKNGVEIYEGDIVRTKYKEYRDFGDEKADYFTSFVEEVVWLHVLNGFGLVYHIEDIPVYRPLNYTTDIRGVKLIEVEVISNTYDNPELLEETE